MAPSARKADLTSDKADKHPFRTLLIFPGAGGRIFASGFFLVLYAVAVCGQVKLESSVVGFCP